MIDPPPAGGGIRTRNLVVESRVPDHWAIPVIPPSPPNLDDPPFKSLLQIWDRSGLYDADAKPPHLVFWCVGVAFGVMLWFLKLFACRYDGEAPQEHLYLGLLAYSQRCMRPLS